MLIQELHTWPETEDEALSIQQTMQMHTVLQPLPRKCRLVAGIDTAYDPVKNITFSAVGVFSLPDLKKVDSARARMAPKFPYIPGLHAFREGPVLLKAIRRLTVTPDVVIFTGHGIAHPRLFGLASHMGVILGCPTIGCARKRLAGQHAEVGEEQGASTDLILRNKPVGVVYRSRENVKPVYISPGHLCTIEDAMRIITGCLRGYRLPEPLRFAHRMANRNKRDYK